MQQVQTIVLDDAGRVQLIDMVIGMLQRSDDERAPGAIAEYQRQRAEVVARMASGGSADEVGDRDQQGPGWTEGKPPAQVVGMQTLSLRAN